MDMIERKRRLRAIRRLSPSFPDHTSEDRLEKIEAIASGKADPSIVRRKPSADLAQRLEAGIASRSPRVGDKQTAKKAKAEKARSTPPTVAVEDDAKKRKSRLGRDRQERGGQDRSE